MASDSYRLHLLSDYWRQQVRPRVLERDGHRCCECGSRRHLQVHHLAYTVNGHNIVGREADFLFLLETLCSECHEARHTVTLADLYKRVTNFDPKL